MSSPLPTDPSVDPDKLRIVLYPASVLREKAQEIPEVTDTVRAVAARMFELMLEAQGVGLAAPQVGLSWRMFVVNATEEDPEPRVFINPTLSEPSGELEPFDEGCLSLPGIRAEVRRPAGVTITATDLNGEAFTLTSDVFPARVWQHEFDHLEGVMIIDKMRLIDRRANQRALRDLEAGA